MKKNIILALATSLAFPASAAFAQQNSNRYQPYTPPIAYSPPVVGGLPPGSSGLEQPVYVAERLRPGLNDALENGELGFLTAEGLGFDPSKAVPSKSQMDQFEAATLIAVIGEEPVLLGDLFPPEKLTSKIVSDPQFQMMARKGLAEVVTRKALAQRFSNDKVSGKSVKERAEAKKHMKTQTAKIFHTKWVPMQMEKMKCKSALEFEEKLAESGKSLQGMLVDFSENTWAQEHVRESVPERPIVELSEMQDHYNDHIEEFRRPSRVRYQMLSAIYSKYPNKDAAFQAIADMGNQVRLGGAPLNAVAKRQSTGLGASDGGQFDWTTQGALKSKEIDKAIFENPVGGLSPIIADTEGFHIVEVLEREVAYTQTFAQAQPEIRGRLIKEKTAKLRADFIQKVLAETPVWTQWPEDIPGSQSIDLLR